MARAQNGRWKYLRGRWSKECVQQEVVRTKIPLGRFAVRSSARSLQFQRHGPQTLTAEWIVNHPMPKSRILSPQGSQMTEILFLGLSLASLAIIMDRKARDE